MPSLTRTNLNLLWKFCYINRRHFEPKWNVFGPHMRPKWTKVNRSEQNRVWPVKITPISRLSPVLTSITSSKLFNVLGFYVCVLGRNMFALLVLFAFFCLITRALLCFWANTVMTMMTERGRTLLGHQQLPTYQRAGEASRIALCMVTNVPCRTLNLSDASIADSEA